MAKKGCLAVLVALAITGAAHAQITISGGLALSYMSADVDGNSSGVTGGFGIGGNVYLDYLLPIGIPLSLGGEIGVDTATFTTSIVNARGVGVPLLLRVAYHFDLMSQLDLYLVGKIGGAIGYLSGDNGESYTGGGFAFGIDLGVAYYFTSVMGMFAEVGIDDYMMSKEVEGYTFNFPFYRFFTIGISAKF